MLNSASEGLHDLLLGHGEPPQRPIRADRATHRKRCYGRSPHQSPLGGGGSWPRALRSSMVISMLRFWAC